MSAVLAASRPGFLVVVLILLGFFGVLSILGSRASKQRARAQFGRYLLLAVLFGILILVLNMLAAATE